MALIIPIPLGIYEPGQMALLKWPCGSLRPLASSPSKWAHLPGSLGPPWGAPMLGKSGPQNHLILAELSPWSSPSLPFGQLKQAEWEWSPAKWPSAIRTAVSRIESSGGEACACSWALLPRTMQFRLPEHSMMAPLTSTYGFLHCDATLIWKTLEAATKLWLTWHWEKTQ